MIAVDCGKRLMQSVALLFDLAVGFILLVPPARAPSPSINPNYDHRYDGYVVTNPQGCTHPERTGIASAT
jgi:hypothetical protein